MLVQKIKEKNWKYQMDPDAKYQEIEQLEKEIDKLTIIERIKALEFKIFLFI